MRLNLGSLKLVINLKVANLGFMIDFLRCILTNWGSEIKDFDDLHTHLNCSSDFRDSLERISTTSSCRRVGNGSVSLCPAAAHETYRLSAEARRMEAKDLLGFGLWDW